MPQPPAPAAPPYGTPPVSTPPVSSPTAPMPPGTDPNAYYQQPTYPQAGYTHPGYAPPGYAQPGFDPATGLPYSDKSKVVAGVLQLAIGSFGVGRFYTGHTGMAIAQIAVTWLTCGIGVIWPIVDGILILTQPNQTDAQGRVLRP
ncbi:NINE protein [Luedemannella flava]